MMEDIHCYLLVVYDSVVFSFGLEDGAGKFAIRMFSLSFGPDSRVCIIQGVPKQMRTRFFYHNS